MSYFVLEIGFEEMPARFLNNLEQDLKNQFTQKLDEQKINFKEIRVYSTPRRLIGEIIDIANKQAVEQKEIIGPPVNIAKDKNGHLTKAGFGFVKSQQVELDAVYEKDTDKGKYLAVRKTIGGKDSTDVLEKICPEIISKLYFPKKMRWSSDFTFGRPIRWILAMFEDKIINFKLADVSSSNLTYGHRVMGPGPFKIAQAKNLLSVLEQKGKVILAVDKRKDIIVTKGNQLAEAIEGKIIWNESLLNEVSYLVEYPKPLLGRFSDKFLQLPEEVLLTSMETHQKSFGLRSKTEGKILPYFLTIINLEPKDYESVKIGWERVLKARLEDANFFWQTDLKSSFEDWLQKLEKVTFLAPLGSMRFKSDRLVNIIEWLGERFYPECLSDLKRSALLAKCDLVSEMVTEFPELEGIMGGIYAEHKGESPIVARAIYEHYLPKGQGELPASLEGSLLSLADKIDTLVGCFGLDIIPTGAADPYALRRNALGVIQIILKRALSFSLTELLKYSYSLYGDVAFKEDQINTVQKLMNFFKQRLKYFWQEQGLTPQVIEATLGAGWDNIYDTYLRLQALTEFSKEKEFESAVLTFKRVANIIKKQANKNEFFLEIKVDLLKEPEEQKLYLKIQEFKPRFETFFRQKNYKQALELLLDLKPVVDNFFDNVMVMCKEQDLRKNRLTMLKNMTMLLADLADFDALQI
ncbi:MAG: glycine--tRNA ligase subunit beta [Desulfonauticus sp.]|nr:glycine--tRNA ligase subunit beta [Desulfonauticus sp.]